MRFLAEVRKNNLLHTRLRIPKCLRNQKFDYLDLIDRLNCIGFIKDDIHTYSLTFTRGWAPRPLFISFTSTGSVSITENVALIAGIVGC